MTILQVLLDHQEANEDQLLAEAVQPLFENQVDLELSEPQEADAVIAGLFGTN